MCDCRFDLTYNDFNPTVLFVSKQKMQKNAGYHDHDFAELAYILSGKGKYYIEGSVYEVEAGDLIICNPGIRHNNIVTNLNEPTIEFIAGFTDFHFRNMPPNSIELREGGFILHTEALLHKSLSRLCYSMLAENSSKGAGKYFMLKSYLMQMMLMIIRENVEHEQKQAGYHFESNNKTYAVSQIVNYIDEHYNEKISLDQIAQNMYLSPVYVSKIFKEETGETPINYLIKIRLEKAKEKLSPANPDSIKNIANSVGYEDAYHFSKLFKKYYGVSPLSYKKRA